MNKHRFKKRFMFELVKLSGVLGILLCAGTTTFADLPAADLPAVDPAAKAPSAVETPISAKAPDSTPTLSSDSISTTSQTSSKNPRPAVLDSPEMSVAPGAEKKSDSEVLYVQSASEPGLCGDFFDFDFVFSRSYLNSCYPEIFANVSTDCRKGNSLENVEIYVENGSGDVSRREYSPNHFLAYNNELETKSGDNGVFVCHEFIKDLGDLVGKSCNVYLVVGGRLVKVFRNIVFHAEKTKFPEIYSKVYQRPKAPETPGGAFGPSMNWIPHFAGVNSFSSMPPLFGASYGQPLPMVGPYGQDQGRSVNPRVFKIAFVRTCLKSPVARRNFYDACNLVARVKGFNALEHAFSLLKEFSGAEYVRERDRYYFDNMRCKEMNDLFSDRKNAFSFFDLPPYAYGTSFESYGGLSSTEKQEYFSYAYDLISKMSGFIPSTAIENLRAVLAKADPRDIEYIRDEFEDIVESFSASHGAVEGWSRILSDRSKTFEHFGVEDKSFKLGKDVGSLGVYGNNVPKVSFEGPKKQDNVVVEDKSFKFDKAVEKAGVESESSDLNKVEEEDIQDQTVLKIFPFGKKGRYKYKNGKVVNAASGKRSAGLINYQSKFEDKEEERPFVDAVLKKLEKKGLKKYKNYIIVGAIKEKSNLEKLDSGVNIFKFKLNNSKRKAFEKICFDEAESLDSEAIVELMDRIIKENHGKGVREFISNYKKGKKYSLFVVDGRGRLVFKHSLDALIDEVDSPNAVGEHLE